MTLTSAVLAAATASSGRFAALGEMDQRYYAVTSAAQLFRDSLGDDDELTLVFTQEKADDGTVKLVYPTGTFGGEDDGAQGYNFLPVVTYYALFGTTNAGTTVGNAVDVPNGQYANPFELGAWKSGNVERMFSYEIAADEASGLKDQNVDVYVAATLKKDWTLDLDFCNKKPAAGETKAESPTAYHLGMTYAASVSTVDVPSSSGASMQHQTTVTWKLQQVKSGGEW